MNFSYLVTYACKIMPGTNLVKATSRNCHSSFTTTSSNGTSHLKRYVEKCPKRANHDIRNFCISNSPSSGGTSNMALKHPDINLVKVHRVGGIYVVSGAHYFSTCEE